ncbi:MAG: PilZ domain-containing protein [Nitrospirae bacterium]|nr:PilZ domain-containing protein [Nitrospirota bacterium]
MASEKKQNSKAEEKREYFRVDDVLAVVANPVDVSKEKDLEFLKQISSSKAFSLSGAPYLYEKDAPENAPDFAGNKKLYGMMEEIKTKLDFIINHFLLEKEGLLSPEKKPVNISASGVRFTIDRPVKEKDIMQIKLLLPTYPPVVVFAYGEVKRIKSLGDGSYEVALEYLNMTESVRNEIIQYAFNHQREEIRKSRETETNE